MSETDTANAMREIDNLASQARQVFNNGGDSQTVRGNLPAIQLAAQDVLRDVLAETAKETVNTGEMT